MRRDCSYHWVSDGRIFVGGGGTVHWNIHSSIESLILKGVQWEVIGELPENGLHGASASGIGQEQVYIL